MGTISRAFTKQGAVEIEAVAAALQPKFAVTAGPEKAVSHTWLDTFDWRLHEAGISLEYLDDGPLILQLPDGSRLQSPRAKKWPALLHDLPAGRLRDALAPIVAPRALLSVVTVQRAVRESRVLNDDEKTVARLLTESVDDGTSRLRLQARLVTLENIQKTVADYYKLRIADLLSKRRSRSVARPRSPSS